MTEKDIKEEEQEIQQSMVDMDDGAKQAKERASERIKKELAEI